MIARRAYGLFDQLALSVHYDFTRAEVEAALQETDAGGEIIRTILHETTHLYQLTSTPYGFYYAALKQLQANQALAAIRALSDAGVPIRVPLGAYVESLPRGAAVARAGEELLVWYLAEAMLLYLEGAFGTFLRHFAEDPLLQALTPARLFEALDGALRGSDVPEVPRLREPDATEQRREAMLIVAKNDGQDAVAVLESGATAAEYWDARPPLPDFAARVHDVYSFRRFDLLYRAAGLLGWSSPRELVLSFAALCEVALCAPLPPHLASLRSEGMTLHDLHPLARFLTALFTAEHVQPVRDLHDYARFQEEVCTPHGWPTPVALSRAAAGHRPSERVAGAITDLYERAQAYRAEVPFAFADLDVWRSPAPAAQRFTAAFVHPIIEFRDSCVYHRDKERVAVFVQSYLVQTYLRQLVLSGETTVRAPFPLAPDQAAFYRELIEVILARAGIGEPRIELVGGSAHEARGRLAGED